MEQRKNIQINSKYIFCNCYSYYYRMECVPTTKATNWRQCKCWKYC